MPDADPALLHQILEQEGVVVDAGEPSRLEWLGAVVSHWWDGLMDSVTLDESWGWYALVVLGIVALALGAFLAWVVLRRLVGVTAAPKTPKAAVRAVAARLDRGMAEALLSAGHRREAARLAWLWMVEGLGAVGIGEPHADQTHNEFVGSVDRHNPTWPLRGSLRELRRDADRLCYAPEEPDVDAVVAWFDAVGGLRAEAEQASTQPSRAV